MFSCSGTGCSAALFYKTSSGVAVGLSVCGKRKLKNNCNGHKSISTTERNESPWFYGELVSSLDSLAVSLCVSLSDSLSVSDDVDKNSFMKAFVAILVVRRPELAMEASQDWGAYLTSLLTKYTSNAPARPRRWFCCRYSPQKS